MLSPDIPPLESDVGWRKDMCVSIHIKSQNISFQKKKKFIIGCTDEIDTIYVSAILLESVTTLQRYYKIPSCPLTS